MIPFRKHHIDEEDIQEVVDVLRKGSLTQGSTIERFALGLGQSSCETIVGGLSE
jgi:dTDP-4-amino-4,6-dideoxygalactose transaminase